MVDNYVENGIYSVYTEGAFMQKRAKIFSLGNSNAFRFTKEIMEALHLKSNDEVVYEITENDELLIRKANKSAMHFDDFVKGHRPAANLSEDDLGGPVGRELL